MSYSVYRQQNGYVDRSLVHSTSLPNIFSYTDTSVVAGLPYDYFVSANNTLFG